MLVPKGEMQSQQLDGLSLALNQIVNFPPAECDIVTRSHNKFLNLIVHRFSVRSKDEMTKELLQPDIISFNSTSA